MTLTLPSGRAGQLIAVLLFLTALAGLWCFLAVPLVDFYDDRRQDLENRAMQAAHLKALVDALPRLKESFGADMPAPAMTLDGATDSVAAASLQGAIQDMVKNAGANLGSVEIMPVEVTEGLRRIGLKVTLSGSLVTVTRLLSAIDHAEPPILVDELQIHGNIVRVPIPGNGPLPVADDPRLDVSFAAYGFRQNQAERERP